VTKDRGKPIRSERADVVVATVHPSSILRAPDAEARAQATRDFVRDLKVVAGQLRRGA
jgi:uracil-DNA glycosylase